MCEALEKLTEAEGRELKTKVDNLVAWKNRVTGALGLVLGLSGLIAWFLYRAVDKMDMLSVNIGKLSTNLAVFETRVDPFITAGPRFTEEDFKNKIEVTEVRFFSKVEKMIAHEVQLEVARREAGRPNLLPRLDALEERIGRLETKTNTN